MAYFRAFAGKTVPGNEKNYYCSTPVYHVPRVSATHFGTWRDQGKQNHFHEVNLKMKKVWHIFNFHFIFYCPILKLSSFFLVNLFIMYYNFFQHLALAKTRQSSTPTAPRNLICRWFTLWFIRYLGCAYWKQVTITVTTIQLTQQYHPFLLLQRFVLATRWCNRTLIDVTKIITKCPIVSFIWFVIWLDTYLPDHQCKTMFAMTWHNFI